LTDDPAGIIFLERPKEPRILVGSSEDMGSFGASTMNQEKPEIMTGGCCRTPDSCCANGPAAAGGQGQQVDLNSQKWKSGCERMGRDKGDNEMFVANFITRQNNYISD
jgi:hypothetical protein